MDVFIYYDLAKSPNEQALTEGFPQHVLLP